MKKKRWRMILLLFICIGSALFLMVRLIQNKQIPYIAFMYNSTRENCLYICTDGDIYASTSEESFVMSHEEVIDKIKQNDYSDILKYVGKTNAGKVRKMYRLFSRVVLDEDYYVDYISMDVPASTEYGGKEGYWYGIYESEYDEFNEIEEGELMTCAIYISNAGYYCTDKRGYKIVDWMHEVLKDYMK